MAVASSHARRFIGLVMLTSCAALTAAFSANRPNIVLIMADDQDGNRVRQDYADYMPMHRYMRDHGTTFINHCADSPQCGPSRAATLSGRLPHNNGFLENGDTSGASIAAWSARSAKVESSRITL